MKISFRARKNIRRILTVLLGLMLAAIIALLCWFIWLGRYVVYTRDQGAVLDFNLPPIREDGKTREPPDDATISIYYNEGDDAINTSHELTQMAGYYVEKDAMKNGLEDARKQIQDLPAGTAVMVPLKNQYGSFFYDSRVSSTRSDSIDTAAVEDFLSYLDKSGMYTIAVVPAFRDREYGLNHVTDGLPDAAYNGGALWSDDDGCYWLNPSSQGTLTYLIAIANELRDIGFDEVVFSDFCFPETERIMFDGDRTAALVKAASGLIASCSNDRFTVSFVGNGSWTLPEGRTRLYLEGVDPANVDEKAESVKLTDPKIQLVFLTDLHDTRFDEYSVLRPLSAAH